MSEKTVTLELTEEECRVIADVLEFADKRDSMTHKENRRINGVRTVFNRKWSASDE